MAFVTGDVAAEATGRTIAEVDEAAATGVIPAKYRGWQLLVNVNMVKPPVAPKAAATKKRSKRKPKKKTPDG